MKIEKHFSPQWRDALITHEGTIRQALSAIQASGALMACFVSETGMLKAIVTDSDIRQALLNGAQLSDAAWPWANERPVVAFSEMPLHDLINLAERTGVRELPLIDQAGHLVDIFLLAVHKERIEAPQTISKTIQLGLPVLPNAMLIQAGGLGTRLRSVVEDRPKPLALVGNRPIIETLIFQAVANGFRKFYVSLNYKAEMIEEHLQLPQYRDLEIIPVRETERLGTAGSISLIADEISESLLVCNADVLTTVPFRSIISHHERENADITVSVRPYSLTIPYGVVELQNGSISQIKEKPEKSFLVVAGIYALSSKACRLVQKKSYIDMPDVIQMAKADKLMKISPFLLHEYWIDIGQPEDFHRANREFENNFRNQ